ncbi:MAG: hypothetical protein WC413_03730 [Candidatus Nanoarchaeia archaeon]
MDIEKLTEDLYEQVSKEQINLVIVQNAGDVNNLKEFYDQLRKRFKEDPFTCYEYVPDEKGFINDIKKCDVDRVYLIADWNKYFNPATLNKLKKSGIRGKIIDYTKIKKTKKAA